MGGTFTKKINKEIEGLDNTKKQLDLTVIYDLRVVCTYDLKYAYMT